MRTLRGETMADSLTLLVCNLPSVACIAAATILAYKNEDGEWGWFLFVAFLMHTWPG